MVTNAAQCCHHSVTVVMDVKGWTLLLQDRAETGGETETDGDITVDEAALLPGDPVQAGWHPPSL